MAKNQQDDFSMAAPFRSVANPTPKIGLLIRYQAGRKEEAIQEAFDLFGSVNGVRSMVGACGQSREWAIPEAFPHNNLYVPGHEGAGMMFVKYEMLD